MHRLRFAAIVPALLALILGSCAQPEWAGTEAPGAPGVHPDDFFMEQAAHLNLGEIETARIALARSTNEDVRNFAQRMIDDHTQLNNDLARLAARKQVTLPTRPDEAHRNLMSHLLDLTGTWFDREYMAAMVADHAAAVEVFENKVDHTRDPEVRSFADEGARILTEHLNMARNIYQQLSGGETGTMSPY